MKQNRESLEPNHTKFEGCAEKAIVNESEIAALVKHRKAEAIPLNEAIERIVAGVDINFPSAYNPHISVDHILGDGPGRYISATLFQPWISSRELSDSLNSTPYGERHSRRI